MSRFREPLLVVLAFLLTVALAPAQPAPQDPAKPGDKYANEFTSAIDIPTDPKLKKRLDAAGDYIREESWGEAVRILQGLLDISEDKFVEDEGTGADGKKTTKWVSVRTKANQLLGTLPPAGRERYELEFGP